jgi:protein phosphatase
LFYLDLKNGDEDASWTSLNTSGKSPGKRYGHTLCCIFPNIILFGGNTGSAPSNDVYIINLNQEINNYFIWSKLELNSVQLPTPRVYHAASVCSKGNASGMMILFGGRDQQDHALNDTWGLRKHRDGTWDWTKAPVQSSVVPKKRYNVILFIF